MSLWHCYLRPSVDCRFISVSRVRPGRGGRYQGKQQMSVFTETIPLVNEGFPLANALWLITWPSLRITLRFNTLPAPDKLLQPTVARPEVQAETGRKSIKHILWYKKKEKTGWLFFFSCSEINLIHFHKCNLLGSLKRYYEFYPAYRVL